MTNDANLDLEILPVDISPYRKGNVGIDYVHRFESGRPGPDVLISALVHGNELCGMYAVKRLLDIGVRPKIGSLTLLLANVEAYESFDASRPFDSRQIVHNMNRIWSADQLEGPEDSPELRRARALAPVIAAADHVLDIHSTANDVGPFWVYVGNERNARVASEISPPTDHLIMPGGLGSGRMLIEYGSRADRGVSLAAECGQHFKEASKATAIQVADRFLSHFGIATEPTDQLDRAVPIRRFELLQTVLVRSDHFRFARPVVGFETFDQGELIAVDDEEELRSPCDRCTIFMPTRRPIVGREAFILTRPLQRSGS